MNQPKREESTREREKDQSTISFSKVLCVHHPLFFHLIKRGKKKKKRGTQEGKATDSLVVGNKRIV